MATSRWLLPLPVALAMACTTPVANDTLGDPSSRTITPSGVIEGSIVYSGPRPCSMGGHIVGNAVILAFDARVPPPPGGLANTAVNFIAVPGDAVFPNEPRWGGSTLYCPVEHGFTETVTASVPFSMSPLAGAEYLLESFYDTTGNFLPTFKFRNLPEKGDVGGGDIDTANALLPVNDNPNYLPHFLPVDVGIPQPLPKVAGDAGVPDEIPIFTIPASGFVASGVTVTLGEVLTQTRPYFYAQGLQVSFDPTKPSTSPTNTAVQSSDVPENPSNTAGIPGSADIDNPNYAPVLTIPADLKVLAPPTSTELTGMIAGGNNFDAHLPHLRLVWGAGSQWNATATAAPFNMQITPFKGSSAGGNLPVWGNEIFDASTQLWTPIQIPEGNNLPELWPLVVLSKLVDDPKHTLDPASIQAQGDANTPVVIMQGITLLGSSTPSMTTDGDNLVSTGLEWLTGAVAQKNGEPNVTYQDHVTILLRPNVICYDSLFDASNSDKRGTIVAPYLTGDSADLPTPVPNSPIVPIDLLTNDDPKRAQVTSLVKAPPGWKPGTPPGIQGCLPKGRYALNVVYPTGQAWTAPNESGSCLGPASGEGSTEWTSAGGQWTSIQCSAQQRPVVGSQGPRAVIEVVDPTDPNDCKPGGTVPPTPAICCPASGCP